MTPIVRACWYSNILSVAQLNETTWPTIFAIAVDHLPIQASSVPCERAFSSSAETDTKKWNRINPVLMEALQMLKFALKKKRLDFMTGWITSESEMTADEDLDDIDWLGSMLDTDPTSNPVDEIIRMLCKYEGDADGNA